MDERLQNFIAQLDDAFPAKPIRSADVFASWGATYPDAAEYVERIEGRTWREIDHEYLVRRSDALGFLGTDHLVAVLPIYLRAMAKNGVWSPATGMLTTILSKPDSKNNAGIGIERFDELLALLTESQRRVVASALAIIAYDDMGGSLGRAARAALDACWNAYLPSKEKLCVDMQSS